MTPFTNNTAKLINLISIADESGVSGEDWFVDEIEKLTTRFDNYRYEKLRDKTIRSEGFPSLLNQVFRKPVLPEELKDLEAEFQIGKIADTEIPVGLSTKSLNLHTVIAGASGFGKTSCLNVLSDSIQKQGKIMQWFIDPKTSQYDFRWLVKHYPNFVVLPLDVLKLNPFGSIKGVPRKAIKETVIQTLSDSYSVFDASQGVIAKHIDMIYEKYEHPCFQDFVESLMSEKSGKFSRRQGYVETIEVRITLTQLSLKKVFDCRVDFFNELYDKNVIFEIGGISDFAQKVLVPFIINKLSLYKTYNPD